MSRGRVLIADNDNFFLEVFRDTCIHAGFEVACATDGHEALKLTKTFWPETIILDVMMPPGDYGGYATCRELKLDPQTAEIPIVLFSNLGDQEDIREGYNRGGDHFRRKPQYADLELPKVLQDVPDLLEQIWQFIVGYRLRPIVRATFSVDFTRLNEQGDLRYAYNNRSLGGQPAWKQASADLQFDVWQRDMTFIADAAETYYELWFKALQHSDEHAEMQYQQKREEWRPQVTAKGKQLFRSVFEHNGRVMQQWGRAQSDTSFPERLVLRFIGPQQALPLPFECLQDTVVPLAIRHPMSRQMNHCDTNQPTWRTFLAHAKGDTLRALILTGAANAVSEAQIVKEKLAAALAKVGIGLEVDPPDLTVPLTAEEAMQWLAKPSYHIVHYAGHAVFDRKRPENSYLSLADGDGAPACINSTTLHNLLNGSPVQFLFLSCCSGAEIGNPDVLRENSFLGLLDATIQAGVPAALGYRWPTAGRSSTGRRGCLPVTFTTV